MLTEIQQWNRGDAGFRGAVEGAQYNALPTQRSPDLVVRPTNEDALVRAVLAARQAKLKIAVRSGGCSWIGSSIRNEGMLIDMNAFDCVVIDASARMARVGPAVRSERFGSELASVGLAFPVGHCGVPAMGGYLLAGGLGFNWAFWQPACFSIRRIRVVTASGEAIDADEDRNTDLLWMARGAGSGFPGIVTEFELALKARPADTRVSSWYFPLEAVDAVTRWVSDASAGLPLNVEVAVRTMGPDRLMLPPGDGMPDHLIAVAALAFVDDEAEAKTVLSPLVRPTGAPALMHRALEAIPFEKLYLGAEVAHPAGHRVLVDTFWTDRTVHAALAPLTDIVQRAPSGKSSVVAIMPGHGAARSGVPVGAGAYSMDERTLVLAYATWNDASDDAANQAWMAELVDHLERSSTGYFLSETDVVRHPERASRSFSNENWKRMNDIRRKWDPKGLFHGYL